MDRCVRLRVLKCLMQKMNCHGAVLHLPLELIFKFLLQFIHSSSLGMSLFIRNLPSVFFSINSFHSRACPVAPG